MLGQLCLLMAVQAVSHHLELHEKRLNREQIILLRTGPDCQQWIGTVWVLQLCLISSRLPAVDWYCMGPATVFDLKLAYGKWIKRVLKG